MSPLWINRIFNKIRKDCFKILYRKKWTKYELSFVWRGVLSPLVGIHGITMIPLPDWLSSTTNTSSTKVPSCFYIHLKRKRGRPLPSPFCPFRRVFYVRRLTFLLWRNKKYRIKNVNKMNLNYIGGKSEQRKLKSPPRYHLYRYKLFHVIHF